MANETILRSFPSDKLEAIAIEYFKQKDLSGKTPAEAFDLFQSIYQEIRTHDRELREKRNRENGWR